MVNLTYLNDASVFHNLEVRYKAKLIYTYSGLFCIVVNPYKRYPIYTPRVVTLYLGKRKNEVPPHLWAITETAYRNMLTNSKDQSMLITGESGAGKTENTKKVIAYLAMVATSGKQVGKKVSLEDQIVATNPILESYGNAKTSRNDNSSRFGKFIRIHFTTAGKLAGCDIESYLLEKSRITQQQDVERSYHIFYQMLEPYVGELKPKCHLTNDIYDYSFVSQGKVKVDSIDDNEELEYTDSAFEILGFQDTEKWDCYKLTCAVMSAGEMMFKQKGREEQCEPDSLDWPRKVADLMGVEVMEMLKAYCKPKIKVGTEWVTKAQNVDQALNGVGAIARATYDRLFKWLIIKCNDTLIDKAMKKSHFVAVLDIAGFEIFEYNGFEQISINFVNEKLQQFFNHHMFVVEQQEYVSEGIDWAMVDFGMDLAACIIMFEKPMGIWAILEEESLFPKATDKSFEEKLKSTHLGKSTAFAKPCSKTDEEAHFAVIHYAGIVSYNVTAWLDKNKDPVNDTLVDVLKRSTNELLVLLWADHPGQSAPPEEEKDSKKKKKKGASKTVSGVYLVQLNALMTTLHQTEPHFIRCIVPNNHKKPLMVEPPLIMHQLTCNGVLEGIRICMRGFPNRIFYADFKARYYVLGKEEIAKASDNKTGVYALMDKINFDRERYRLGHTKVFFKAGALAGLEECRDEIVSKLLRYTQGQCYGYLRRKVYNQKKDQRELMKVIQRNFRKYFELRDWDWYTLISKTKPMIGRRDVEGELKELEEKCNATYGLYKENLDMKTKLMEENKTIKEEKKAIMKQIEAEQGDLAQYNEKQDAMTQLKAELEVELQEQSEILAQTNQEKQMEIENKKELESENGLLKKDIEDLEIAIQKLEQEKTSRDHTIRSLNDEIVGRDEEINKMNKKKKHLAETSSKVTEELQAVEDKVNHLNNVKMKLEETLDELEDTKAKEKKMREDVEKKRRKVEGELRVAQETVNDLERNKKELESTIARKENDINQYTKKLEDEQTIMAKLQRAIKETQSKVEEMEEELEAERQARSKSERKRSDLAREYDKMTERLTEASGATHAQVELNKKRENEVQRLRKDLEEANIQHDATMMNLKKKHQDANAEMSEQIDQLTKMKAKIEKDKGQIMLEIQDVRAACDEIQKSKASVERSNKNLLLQLNDNSKKVEEASLTLGDYEVSKRKLAAENADLLRQLQELDNSANMLSKIKHQFVTQVDEAKAALDDESKERQNLLAKYNNLEHETDALKDQFEEESASKQEILRQLNKALQEADLWRQKYEIEAIAKSEEIEMTNMKLQARLTEGQSTIEQMNAKLLQIDRARVKLETEISEMTAKTDQANLLNSSMDKKARQFEKIICEWKVKADSLSMDLDVAQKECRNTSAELFRVKSAYEESILQLDEVRKENKSLSNEIKDIMDQISEGGRSIHEIDKIRKRLEVEKLELQSALEEAEGALEQEENKVLRAQLELTQVRAEIERRMREKEDEFQMTKKNFQKAVDSMQGALETEVKGKSEAVRMKKKLESDVTELEVSLEHSNSANQEIQKTIKHYHQQIRDVQTGLEEEARLKDVSRDQLLASERKAHTLQNALEEARTLLEQSDRARRLGEQELCDTNEQLSELTCQNQAISGGKRKLESEIQTLHVSIS